MSNNSVSWKEGMFLLPQHFQYQEQHFDHQLASSAFVNHPFNYGFSNLKINDDALANWQVAIDRASGRTKLGFLFDFLENDVARVDLRTIDNGDVKRALDMGESVKLFLAFPLVRPNIKNISLSDDESRFHETEREVFDLHDGGNQKQIVFKSLQGVVTANNNRAIDFDYLQFAELSLTGSEQGQIPALSKTFIPSSTTSAATEISRFHYQRMWDRLGAYLINLVEYLESAGLSISLLADADLSEPIYRYTQFSELRSWLARQLNAPGDHPYMCFDYLCRLIGRLSVVDPMQERLVNYRQYDHDDIHATLKWAWDTVERNFVKPSELNVRRVPFIAERMNTESGEEVIMKATLTPELFEKNWELFLAFDTNFGSMTDDDRKQFFRSYLRNGAIFYWKLGSHEKINQYFINREQGVDWKNPSRTKEGLPKRGSWYYADIVRDEYWDPVKQSGTICLRIDQSNLRTPASDLGTEKITVGINQRTYQYRVSIFAVRKEND